MQDKIRIDLTTGLRIETVHPSIVGEDIIEAPCLKSFYKPKWNGETWIEGLAQEEINAIKTPIETVESLKTKLEETDYKIIKCYEYQLAGEELPYDVVELHNARQALRDKINQLEAIN